MTISFDISGIQDLGKAIRQLQTQLGGAKNIAGKRVSGMGDEPPIDKPPSPAKFARLLGAGLRYAQNQAPYQLGGLISVAAGLGSFGLALGLGVAALGVFAATIMSGVASLNAYHAGQTQALATAEEAGKLKRLGRDIGVDYSELAGLAGSRQGGASQLLQEINAVLGEKSEFNRQRMLQQLKLPPQLENLIMLGFTKLPENYGKDSERSPQQLQAAALLEQRMGELSEAFQKLKEFGIVPLLVWLRLMFPWLAHGDPKTNPNAAMDRSKQVVDNLDRSMNRLADAFDAYSWANDKSGKFGGIDPVRARAAYPSNWAWSADALRAQNQQDILNMGAFTL